MMFKKHLLAILCVCAGNMLFAQDRSITGAENGTNLNVLYKNEASGKVYANTRGFGVSFKKAKHVTAKTKSFFEIDAQNLRHPKEIKVTGEAQNKKRFVYGKINSVFLLRGDLGLQNVIFSKADSKAIEVRYSSSLGATIGFAKPYYVQVVRRYNNASEKAVPFNSDSFTQDSVIGRGAFSDGLAETKFYPGINAKFNLSFEYAPYTNIIRAIETGISVDYFPKALPIMARNPAENIIITFHVGFVFGQRWF
jgi:hypothetical protein